MWNNQHEPLRNLALIITSIRSTGATGRLALRNTVRVGMLHLYFDRGQLVHLEGGRASIDDAIVDLAGWTAGQIRFDSGVRSERQTITLKQKDFFERTLLFLQQQNVIQRIANTTPSSPERQPERQRPGSLPAALPLPPVLTAKAEVLVTSRQWGLLVEVVRAMLEQVGQLFGQRQVQNILQHVLIEQSRQSEVLGLLQVDRQGRLREARQGEMLTQPVQDVAGGFVLLISDFERRCAALLGEDRARQMIAQALSPYGDALAEIGIAINS